MNAYAYSDAGNGYGYSYLRIRGFDQSRIAVNVNGVPLNTPESHQVYSIDLGDFATGLGLIQIQRGPGNRALRLARRRRRRQPGDRAEFPR